MPCRRDKVGSQASIPARETPAKPGIVSGIARSALKLVTRNRQLGQEQRHKRVVITQYGDPEVITIIEEDIPTPKVGEVRVKVLAQELLCRTSWRARASIRKRRTYPTR
jgi:hypothetical protein